MSADRQIPTSSTVGAVTGDDFMDDVQEELTGLWNVAIVNLTNVSGTNDIQATPDPALVGSLVDGMNFNLTPANTTTGAARLSLDAGSNYYDIVRQSGDATQAGDLVNAKRVYLSWDGTNSRYVLMAPTDAAPGADINRPPPFTSSGTWTKPSGLNPDALVIVEAWGAGGGGSSNSSGGGGGGGAYVRREFKASDLSATETVTIGAGGSTNTAGGNTTFGSHVTAYGGGGAYSGATYAGGGGGSLSAGSNGTSSGSGNGGAPTGGIGGVFNTTAATGSSFGGGGGGVSGTTASPGGDSGTGGGGGGGGSNAAATTGDNGGNSLFGGGGGAGKAASGTPTAGTSVFGGNGGAAGAAGTAPAGGGGQNAAGARGECRVTVIG